MGKEEEEKWNTGEELLLACAVKRHGFHNWESVSMEIQSRSSLPQLLTTPYNCQLKFQDLNRRFTAQTQNESEEDDGDSVPWLNDLRKLRVAELRQEVHRYDVSILSLQSKVKQLEEEREGTSTDDEYKNVKDDEKPDLENASKPDRSEKDNRAPVHDNFSSGRVIAGEESNQSVNGSNSTGTKAETAFDMDIVTKKDPQRFISGSGKPDPVCSGSKQVAEDSCNESSDSIAGEGGGGLSSFDKVNALKGEECDHWTKEAGTGTATGSDVHSSASLTRKRRRIFEISGGAVEDEAFRGIKRVASKSQPLVAAVLEMIRSHKHGSLFDSRLQSQETDNYNNTIRQHMDLQRVQTRLEQGCYSSCSLSLYRDLLLLFTNALVFFPRSSVEFIAARQLRFLVCNKMEEQFKHTRRTSHESVYSPPNSPQPRPDLGRSDSLLAKHKSSAPIIVCRKRSSISARKAEHQNGEKKTIQDPIKSSLPDIAQEQSLMNKDTIATGTRSMRRSSNNQESTSPGGSGKQTAAAPSKAEKKMDNDTSSSMIKNKKKRGAADFLKRIKGNNSPVEKSKNDSKMSTRGNGGVEQTPKKTRGNSDHKKDGNKMERVLRQSSGGKRTAKDETDSPSKKSVGRPPKRSADSLIGKRGREPETKQSRKRSRR